MAEKILTPKQQRFVDEYLIDLNATQAAIRAGYSAKSAEVQAAKMLRIPKVQSAVQIGQQAKSEQTKIDAAYVLNRLKDISEMDALDILEEDGTIKPIRQWPKIWRQMISWLDVANNPDTGVVLKKIKWPDKIRNLELIGRHVGVGAFRDKIELSGEVSLVGDKLRMRKHGRGNAHASSQ